MAHPVRESERLGGAVEGSWEAGHFKIVRLRRLGRRGCLSQVDEDYERRALESGGVEDVDRERPADGHRDRAGPRIACASVQEEDVNHGAYCGVDVPAEAVAESRRRVLQAGDSRQSLIADGDVEVAVIVEVDDQRRDRERAGVEREWGREPCLLRRREWR